MSMAAQDPRAMLPGRKLLVLQNPGRGSRNYLEGILSGLRRLGVAHCVLELQEIWAINKTEPAALVTRLSHVLVGQKVGAVIGYGFNGMSDIPLDDAPAKKMRSFFEVRGIPHLMLWLDHPHWHSELVGLSPELQGLFRSANNLHFMKSRAHALEMERICGWPNCFELPAAVDPEQFPLAPQGELSGGQEGGPRYDLVAICSERGELPGWLREFVALENPDPVAIRAVILREVKTALEQLWRAEIPEGLRAETTAVGNAWAELKCAEPFVAAGRHWPRLTEQFPGACWYLTLTYPTYMKALRILWRLREWERRFYLAYLAKYCAVGVFGGDWSPLGLGPGGRVDFLKQSAAYAQGRVALNITDGHDEEGLTLKPFEIAASGVPLLNYFAHGLSELYTEGREIEVFRKPAEARDKLLALLADPQRRVAMAAAARARTLAEHTWERRIERMFALARLPLEAFRVGG